ncbi:hypothetical protein PUN4_200010 [Paraburkholderia unamae]|nr:hypothetical protein PUN4_200010 [Paraburkholderia unamae]
MPSATVLPEVSLPFQVTGTVPADCAPRSSVLTTWPAEFVIVSFTSDTAEGSVTPSCGAVPLDTAALLPGASTVEPISSAAWAFWPAESCVESDESDVLSCWMPETVLICASCDVICELSIGSVGSWFCNCATSSCRNVVCRSLALVPLVDEDELELVPFMVSSSCCDTVAVLPPMVVLLELNAFSSIALRAWRVVTGAGWFRARWSLCLLRYACGADGAATRPCFRSRFTSRS